VSAGPEVGIYKGAVEQSVQADEVPEGVEALRATTPQVALAA
jgi:hypothetical protein